MPKWRAPDVRQYIPDSLEGITDFVFGSTPEEQMMQSLGPAPLVSIYKNAAARKVGTKAFERASEKLGLPMAMASKAFATKYPRIAAHMNLKSAKQFPEGEARIPYGKVDKPVDVVIADWFKRFTGDMFIKDKNLKAARETAGKLLTHEATHTAQALGNSDTRRLYDLLQDLVGYGYNPFEQSARVSAERSVTGRRFPPAANVNKLLLELVNKPVITAEKPAREAIRDILIKRGILK